MKAPEITSQWVRELWQAREHSLKLQNELEQAKAIAVEISNEKLKLAAVNVKLNVDNQRLRGVIEEVAARCESYKQYQAIHWSLVATIGNDLRAALEERNK